MKTFLVYLLVIFVFPLMLSSSKPAAEWGFYAHKTINRMAVFILPPEMLVFFKQHIDYISGHSTDPDKRRYVVQGEAIKHFMDIDHWGEYPFEDVPYRWVDAYFKYLEITAVQNSGDTMYLKKSGESILNDSLFKIDEANLQRFIKKELLPDFHINSFVFSAGQLDWIDYENTTGIKEVLFYQPFLEHGILPYYIKIQYGKLVSAFKTGDQKRILRTATDLGHYIADLHVPLHTTKNYNGQLTGQDGIHAFWESRLPELFAEEQYSYFVGKAQYIPDIELFAWTILLESNHLHYEVLALEKNLRQSIPEDRHFAYDIRLNTVSRLPSEELSTAYHNALSGMVERRMQESVHALGSLWLSAWIDAGQPVLEFDPVIKWTAEELEEMKMLDMGYNTGKELGRPCH